MKTEIKFQTRYSTKLRKGIKNTEPSRTKQSFSSECDVNNILKKYTQTGILPNMMSSSPSYGDFSNPVDYQQSMNTVLNAQAQFASLPSIVRTRFANDPALFLDFASNPKNSEELIKLGLACAKPTSSVSNGNAEEAPLGKKTASSKAKNNANSDE